MRNSQIQYYFFALVLILTSGFCVKCQAQTIDFSAPVSFHYEGQSLSSVLDDLSDKYGLGFSYSRQIIPVNQPLFCRVDKMPFGEAMDKLFAQTQVIYGVIGDQIVLSIDNKKKAIPADMGYGIDGLDDSLASSASSLEVTRSHYEVEPLSWRVSMVYTAPAPIAPEVVAYDLHEQIEVAEEKQPAVRAQVTFVPPLQADSDPHSDLPVNVSVNVLAGVNNSVQGMEIGGLSNVLTGDMKGFQAAGLVNVVSNNFEGFQAAGLVNSVRQQGTGFQAAGLVNLAGGEGDLVQAAGLANLARRDVRGQAAGLFNVARDVDGAQISGLVNVARNVRGVQIGLINVADSVGGVPIGLMSFVRKRGYHSLEFGVEDAIDFNMNLRLGVRGFYNILHVGVDKEGENWSLGYGIGTSIFLARRNYLQFELMSRQVNENEPWTNALNLLSQLRMTYDFALGKNIRFAVGPSFNVATSRRYDPETGTYGTDIPRYVMFEHTYDDGYHLPLNVKYWVGFHAGIRFGTADVTQARFEENY